MDTEDDFGSKSGDDFPDLAVDMPEPPDDEDPQSATIDGVEDEEEAQLEEPVEDEPRMKKAKISEEGVLEHGMDKAASAKSKHRVGGAGNGGAVGGQSTPSQDMSAANPMMASPGSYLNMGYPPMMVMNPQMYTAMVAQAPYTAIPPPMPGAGTSSDNNGAPSRLKGTKDGGTMLHQLPATMMNPAMTNPAMMYNPYMMQQFQGMMNPFMYPRPGMGMFPPPLPSSVSKGISLYLSVDREMLSEYQLMVRQQLELFEAGAEDVESNTQGRKKQVVIGQVGLRCKHCAPFPLRARGRGAVYYPAKLQGIYQAAQNMAGSHLCQACQQIPPQVKAEISKLRERKDNANGGKQYWADGCRALGVYQTEHGLRLSSQQPLEGTKDPKPSKEGDASADVLPC